MCCLSSLLLSQLNQRCTSTALVGWGGKETRYVRVAVQKTSDGPTQGAGAVTVNDSYLAQTRQRRFVEKFIDCIDSFVSSLSNHIQLRLRLLFSRSQLDLRAF